MFARRIIPLSLGAFAIGNTVSVFYPPRVKADVKRYSLNDKLIEDLNKRDKEREIKGYIKELMNWSPTSKYSKILENINEYTLFSLTYMASMYTPPLKEFQKIKIRTNIQEFYKKATSEEEKQMYVDILDYYKLME
jgi:glutamate synthase domain-containing protein 3